MIEYRVNNDLADTNRKYLNEINEIGADEWRRKTKYIETEDVIHRDITENELETNRDTLKKVTE